MTADELLKQARTLTPAEKLALVEALMSDLDCPDSGIDAAWAAEAEDRLAAYRKGQIRAIPLDDVRARLADRGIGERDVAAAVAWARRQPTSAARKKSRK